jgi:hypothetical protein
MTLSILDSGGRLVSLLAEGTTPPGNTDTYNRCGRAGAGDLFLRADHSRWQIREKIRGSSKKITATAMKKTVLIMTLVMALRPVAGQMQQAVER